MSETPDQRVSTATDRRSCPNLGPTFAAANTHGDHMVKVLTAGGRGDGIPIGPVYFPEIMSRTDSFLTRDTRRGAVASFYVYINFSGESRTWTCAYRTVSSYLTCPSITSGPSIDILRAEESHRCFNRQPPIPVALPKMISRVAIISRVGTNSRVGYVRNLTLRICAACRSTVQITARSAVLDSRR